MLESIGRSRGVLVGLLIFSVELVFSVSFRLWSVYQRRKSQSRSVYTPFTAPKPSEVVSRMESVAYVYFWDPRTDEQGFSEVIGPCEDFFCGLSRNQVVAGKFLFSDFVHAEDLKFWRPLNESCHSDKVDFTLELRMKTADGVFCWRRAKAKYVGSREDGKEYWYGVLDDISDLKQLCDEIEKSRSVLGAFEHILESSIDFYFYVDRDLRVFSCGSLQENVKSRYFLDDFIADLEDQNKLLALIRQANSTRLPVRMVQIRIRLPGQLEDLFKAYCVQLPVPLSDKALVALERVIRPMCAAKNSLEVQRLFRSKIPELIEVDLESDVESILGFLFGVVGEKEKLQQCWRVRDISGCLETVGERLTQAHVSVACVWSRFVAWALLMDTWDDESKIAAVKNARTALDFWQNQPAPTCRLVIFSLFYVAFAALRGLTSRTAESLVLEVFRQAVSELRREFLSTEVALLYLQMGLRQVEKTGLHAGAWWFSVAAGMSHCHSEYAAQLQGIALFNLAVCCDHSESVMRRLKQLVADRGDVAFDPRITKLLCVS